MKPEMAKSIVNYLEKHKVYEGHRWKAKVKDGLVYVTEGHKVKKMTWDTFEHFFLKNK